MSEVSSDPSKNVPKDKNDLNTVADEAMRQDLLNEVDFNKDFFTADKSERPVPTSNPDEIEKSRKHATEDDKIKGKDKKKTGSPSHQQNNREYIEELQKTRTLEAELQARKLQWEEARSKLDEERKLATERDRQLRGELTNLVKTEIEKCMNNEASHKAIREEVVRRVTALRQTDKYSSEQQNAKGKFGLDDKIKDYEERKIVEHEIQERLKKEKARKRAIEQTMKKYDDRINAEVQKALKENDENTGEEWRGDELLQSNKRFRGGRNKTERDEFYGYKYQGDRGRGGSGYGGRSCGNYYNRGGYGSRGNRGNYW